MVKKTRAGGSKPVGRQIVEGNNKGGVYVFLGLPVQNSKAPETRYVINNGLRSYQVDGRTNNLIIDSAHNRYKEVHNPQDGNRTYIWLPASQGSYFLKFGRLDYRVAQVQGKRTIQILDVDEKVINPQDAVKMRNLAVGFLDEMVSGENFSILWEGIDMQGQGNFTLQDSRSTNGTHYKGDAYEPDTGRKIKLDELVSPGPPGVILPKSDGDIGRIIFGNKRDMIVKALYINANNRRK